MLFLAICPGCTYGMEVPGDLDRDLIVSDEELEAAKKSNEDGGVSSEDLEKIVHIHNHYPRSIVDGTGTEVTLYKPPERVFEISTGLITKTMFIFGDAEKIVGKGGNSLSGSEVAYTYNGKTYSYSEFYPIEAILHPNIKNVPHSGYGWPPSYETIANTDPDIIIVSTRSWSRDGGESCKQSIDMMRELGVPVIVLNEIGVYDQDETKVVYK
jgi:ABC-type Fe3+-hydroxamate transport system substrate-binding protein